MSKIENLRTLLRRFFGRIKREKASEIAFQSQKSMAGQKDLNPRHAVLEILPIVIIVHFLVTFYIK